MTEVYIVLKNADFTEGRGQMLFHRVYDSMKAAHQYVMSKDGIFGSKQGVSGYNYSDPEKGHLVGYNGYQIIKAPLRTIDSVELEKHRSTLQEKIAKLQEELDSTYQ